MAANKREERALIFLGCTDSRFLELIILPTEDCNFRCTYCYEDFAIGRMSPEIVTGLKALLKRRVGDLEDLSLSWFGGEPLAAYDIVLDVMRYACRLCANGRPSISGGITTNGALLTLVRCRELREVAISNYQISLDGWGEVHDRTRRRRNGKGTFTQIWRNLCAISDADIDIRCTLRLHLTRSNIESVRHLIREIRSRLDPARFSIFLKPVENLGGDSVRRMADELLGHGEEMRTIIKSLLAEIPPTMSDGFNDTLTGSTPHVCYAARANSFVIRANGSVAKCTVAFHDDRNCVGMLLPDGRIKLDPDKMALWLRGLENLDTDVMACPLVGMPKLPDRDLPDRRPFQAAADAAPETLPSAVS